MAQQREREILSACRRCGEFPETARYDGSGWKIVCDHCGFESEPYETVGQALDAWISVDTEEYLENEPPCPFCGDAKGLYMIRDSYDMYRVNCWSCDASGPESPRREEALEMWHSVVHKEDKKTNG